MDHNVLRDEISSARRYRELKNLELSIYGLRNKLPVSLYTELGGRIKERILAFEYPDCNSSKVSVIFSNGLKKTLEQEECHKAMSRGIKLSDYIFSHYVSVRDFEIEDENHNDKRKNQSVETLIVERKGSLEPLTPLSPAELRDRVDYLLEKVENLEKIEKIYSENLPKMSRDVEELKEKVDKIYKRVINE